MSKISLDKKHVLVTLPVTAEQENEFRALVEGVGGSCAFIREHNVSDADVEDVSLIIGNVPAGTLHEPESLEWLQTSSAGYDHYLAPGRLAPTTMLTNATGAYGQAVSEHMFASLLCLMKKLHRYRDNQSRTQWHDEGSVTSLVNATVLVMGAGDIGTAFAKLASSMGAHVWGVRRRVAECQQPFEHMIALSDVHDVLDDIDVVANVLPSSPETRFLANKSFFAAMKPGSYFINAGRGDFVDQNALAEALHNGHLAGAALDVTKPEPLPQGHALWNEPNALITPHVAGFWHLQATTDNVVSICLANLKAYLAGEPLRNTIDR